MSDLTPEERKRISVTGPKKPKMTFKEYVKKLQEPDVKFNSGNPHRDYVVNNRFFITALARFRSELYNRWIDAGLLKTNKEDWNKIEELFHDIRTQNDRLRMKKSQSQEAIKEIKSLIDKIIKDAGKFINTKQESVKGKAKKVKNLLLPLESKENE